jgi:hypothetical protein
MYVIQIVVQNLWSTWEHSLSRFESWENCGNHHKLPKWFRLKFTKYLFPLVKEHPIFEYKWDNINSYSSISCQGRFLRIFLEFFRKVWIPLKFKEDSNSNVFQNLYLELCWELEVDPMEKLFIMFNSTTMTGLNIFGHQDGLHVVFQSLELIWILENQFCSELGPTHRYSAVGLAPVRTATATHAGTVDRPR